MEGPLGYAPPGADGATRSAGAGAIDQCLRTDCIASDEFENDSTSGDSWSDSGDICHPKSAFPTLSVEGDELLTFGNNQNGTLGFSDTDNRQHPERVTIKRPAHLLHRFWREHQEQRSIVSYHLTSEVPLESETSIPGDVQSLPSLIRNRPLVIRDVALSKLHTAVLTSDPESNLYMCGFGPGGRLGTGDETTRFNFVCIDGGGLTGKQIVAVGLGLGHTLAIDSEGDIFSWGTNTYSQLGYTVALGGQESVQAVPRQIFGPLKRELVIGAAASRWHSVVHTSTSLFTFGKNEGQLGLVDSGARSLEIQTTPRKVGASQFSCSIKMVSAIDRATVCLLDNYEVWIFENFGFMKMFFPLEGRPSYSLKNGLPAKGYNSSQNRITKIASGGDTICAMSNMDVFTITVQQKLERGSTASTTNPTKIRNALSQPKRVWSSKKSNTAVRDVGVGQDGSVIICTHSGSVWRQVERVKIKSPIPSSVGDNRLSDHKFSRVPGLTRIVAVRSNAFGAYAAVRRDCSVPKTKITVDKPRLWDDLAPLLSFHGLSVTLKGNRDTLKSFLSSPDLEKDVNRTLSTIAYKDDLAYDVEVSSSMSDVTIPAHGFMLAARSPVLRTEFSELRRSGSTSISELVSISPGEFGVIRMKLQGVDFLSIFNLVLYVYTDTLVDVWNYTRIMPNLASRFRQIRNEMLRIGCCLELQTLENSVRTMTKPGRSLHADMEQAITDPGLFGDGDAIVELADSEVVAHSALICQRCPFFGTLFRGRAAGGWLSSRRERLAETSGVIKIDLKHVASVVFKLVLRHVYADTGEELFDDVVTEDLDEFLDLIMDVLSVANELMLDRLSQISQNVLGRFGEFPRPEVIHPLTTVVTTRNAVQLLNAVAPCSVTRFKGVIFEYLCLNLEAVLENHLLDELDEDLRLELDQVVHERYPDLAAMLDHERRAKADLSLAQTRVQEEENWHSNWPKAKPSAVNSLPSPPMSRKSCRKSPRDANISSIGPTPRSRTGTEHILDMDEGDDLLRVEADSKRELQLRSTVLRGTGGRDRGTQTTSSSDHMSGSAAKEEPLSLRQQTLDPGLSSQPLVPTAKSPNQVPPLGPSGLTLQKGTQSPTQARNWRANPLSPAKLSIKEIMEQTSSGRTSNILLRLPSQNDQEKAPRGKMSQKERKKQQHPAIQPGSSRQPELAPEKPTVPEKPTSPWQSPLRGPKVSLKDILGGSGDREQPESPSLQTLSISSYGKLETADAASSYHAPLKVLPAQSCHQNTTNVPKTAPSPLMALAEPPLQLSLSEIISQQQREREIIKGTVLKRSLIEIQQEQEFQSWWEAESARVRGEEEAEAARARAREKRERGRGRRGGRGKGGRGSRREGTV